MSKIFKHFPRPDAYIFQDVSKIPVDDEPLAGLSPDGGETEDGLSPPEAAQETEEEPSNPLDYAQVQARAVMREAQQEAEEYRQKALHELEDELDDIRRDARETAYQRGYAEGLAEGHTQARAELDNLAKQQAEEIKDFLEEAVRLRDRILDENREELKDLALAVAEKVIRVSLRGSSDILLRMIEAATDKHKSCEWAQIYIAGCDVKNMAYTIPELTAALQPIAKRVRVIPMADDDSGNCIIELPDVIIDASVSTQLGNMKEILDSAAMDKEEF